ncbi:hypothetical protein RIF29_39376 [Crotalaria pallida]|uniref:Uncharacterized protein n=1 Tax=Crotalaria pallida TaxID=3830 RepID=A0AAN9E7D5_CROPI
MDMWKWIREATAGNLSHVFLATLWWAWRWRSSKVLGLENWHVDKVVWNISVTIEELLKWCPKTQPSAREVIQHHLAHSDQWLRRPAAIQAAAQEELKNIAQSFQLLGKIAHS